MADPARRVTQTIIEAEHLEDQPQRFTQALVEVDLLPGTVYTNAVAMPEYEGDERGIPVASDRAAWDTNRYPEHHAIDLKDDLPQRHNPWPMVAGEAAVSDGTKLVATDIATQAELDAHTTAHTSDPGATSKPLSTDANGYLDLVRLYLDELHAETGADLTIQLGDDAGVQKLVIKDSGTTEVASIDSDGLLTTRTLLVVPASSTDTVFRTQSLQSTAPLGSELVTNGTFDSDLSGWTIGGTGTGWSWDAAGKALHATGNVDTLWQNINVVNGTTYQVEFTISDRTAGYIIGGVYIYQYGTYSRFSGGTLSRSLVAVGTGVQALTITPTSDFDGKIDDITVKSIIGNSQANAVYLDDDGDVAIEIRGDAGLYNIFVGNDAGGWNTSGEQNVAIGSDALYANTTGGNNVAIGRQALYANTTGGNNVAIGQQALYANTTSVFNVAIGWQALRANTTGGNNAAIGSDALYANTTGSGNVAIGRRALYANTTGIYNVAIGRRALYDVTEGIQNTAIGYNTGRGITTGDYNTIIGANVTGLDPDRSGSHPNTDKRCWRHQDRHCHRSHADLLRRRRHAGRLG